MAKRRYKALFIGKYSGKEIINLRNYKFDRWEPVLLIGRFKP